MKATDFEVGDEVSVPVLDGEMDGVVRSVQVGKNLVDVQVYQQGHLKNGQTIAFPPEQVKERGESRGPSSYADLQRKVEGERVNREVLETIKGMAEKEASELAAMTSRVTSLEAALAELAGRVAALESAAKPDGGQAASA